MAKMNGGIGDPLRDSLPSESSAASPAKVKQEYLDGSLPPSYGIGSNTYDAMPMNSSTSFPKGNGYAYGK